MEIIIIICLLILIILNIVTIAYMRKNNNIPDNNTTEKLDVLKSYIDEQNRNNRIEINTTLSNALKNMSETLSQNQSVSSQNHAERLSSLDERINAFSQNN